MTPPIVRTRLSRGILAIGVSFALLATACSGSPTRAASGSGGDPAQLPALPGGPAGGPSAPVYEGAIVTPDSWVATSTTPLLSVPGASGGWRFTLTDLSDGKSSFGTKTYDSAGSSARVPAAADLQQGRVYVWRGESAGHDPAGGTFTVDSQMNDVQEVDAIGGASVALASGEASVSWSSHAMSSLAGSVGFGLNFERSNAPEKGVPAGWSLQGASSSPFTYVIERGDRSVGLVATNGVVSNYRKVGAEYVPVQLSGADLNTNGVAPVLLRNPDGSWAITSKDSTSYFDAPDAEGVSYLSSVSSNDKPMLSPTWVDGRLRAISDPVSKRSVDFRYGGGNCPSPAPGFIPAPDGMLCQVKFWDGSTDAVMYVTTPAGEPSIGRVIEFTGAEGDAQVYDFAYDLAGRVSATRVPLVAAAAASGVIGVDDPQYWTSLTYDASGRVASATDFAAAPGAVRCTRSYDYVSTQFTTVSDSCAKKVISQVKFEPSNFFTRQLTNVLGQVSTNEWNDRTGQLLRSVSFDGLVTTNTYESGRLVETRGPTKESLSSAQATRRSYDQEFATNPDGTPMHGLDATYWPSSTDASSGDVQELGPRRDGAITPSLLVNWDASPAGNDGGWSALMTGALQIDTAGTYAFASRSNTARLRVNNVLCVDSACSSMALQPGPQQIRVDVSSPDSAASMDLTWSGPDSGGSVQSIPTARLRPEYGYATTTKSIDPTAVASPGETFTKSTYADPASGELTSRVNQGGAVTRLGYESVKAGSAWGRQDSSTQPGGNSYRLSYWGNTESAVAPCPGASGVNQGGSIRMAVSPGADGGDGPSTTKWVDAGGRTVAVRISDGAITCTSYDAVGRPVATESLGMGQTVRSRVDYAVDGNPLVSEVTDTIGSTTRITHSEIDLKGRSIREVDPYGVSVVTVYDGVTGAARQITTTVPGSASSILTMTYDAAGRLSSTSLDGRPLASTSYNEDGTVSSNSYGDGVASRLSYNQSNLQVGADWTASGGSRWSNTRVISAAGNISSASFTALGRTSTFDYVHDDGGHLSGASVSAGLIDTSRSWAYSFDANSNRTAQTVQSGGVNLGGYTYKYNGADQLVFSNDPAVAGGIEYDACGNATRVGPDSFTYDAANNLVESTDGTTTVTYVRSASGEIISKTTEGGSDSGTVQYAIGGVTLDGAGAPLVQEIPLAGGVTYTRRFGSPGSGSWTFSGLNGSKYFVTDDAGAPVGAPQLYDPFGTALSVPVPTVAGQTQATWQAAAGNETENLKTGYVMMGARVYIPALGRFAQLDPKIGGSANGYDYANQDPVNLGDPTGRSAFDWVITMIVAAATISASLVFPPASGFLIGAAVGAAIGAAGYLITFGIQTAIDGQTAFSITQFAITVISSALLGGISGRVQWASAQRAEQQALGGGPAAVNAPGANIPQNPAAMNRVAGQPAQAPSALRAPAFQPQNAGRLSVISEEGTQISGESSMQSFTSSFHRNSGGVGSYRMSDVVSEAEREWAPAGRLSLSGYESREVNFMLTGAQQRSGIGNPLSR